MSLDGNRKSKLLHDLKQRSGNTSADLTRLIDALRKDDDLMAEFMAICARRGPAPSDSDLEFAADNGEALIPDMWLHAGSGLNASHYLPEPNDPEN